MADEIVSVRLDRLHERHARVMFDDAAHEHCGFEFVMPVKKRDLADYLQRVVDDLRKKAD